MDHEDDRLSGIARAALVNELSAVLGEWREVDGLIRLGTIAVTTKVHGPLAERGHIDIGVTLNLANPDASVIWDCAAGSGASSEDRIRDAVYRWTKGTFAAIAELLVQDGSHATHFKASDPGGCPGWHTICGPCIFTGSDVSAKHNFLEWLNDNPVLPVLSRALDRDSDSIPSLHGIKMVIGTGPNEEIVEVQIDGQADSMATQLLAELSWPRNHQSFLFIRMFALLFPEVAEPH